MYNEESWHFFSRLICPDGQNCRLNCLIIIYEESPADFFFYTQHPFSATSKASFCNYLRILSSDKSLLRHLFTICSHKNDKLTWSIRNGPYKGGQHLDGSCRVSVSSQSVLHFPSVAGHDVAQRLIREPHGVQVFVNLHKWTQNKQITLCPLPPCFLKHPGVC